MLQLLCPVGGAPGGSARLSERRRCEAGPAGTECVNPGVGAQDGGVGAAAAEVESSDSEPEQEHGSPQKLIRKVLHVRSDPEQGNIPRACCFRVGCKERKAPQTERPV